MRVMHGVSSEYHCCCSGVLVVPEAADRLASIEATLPCALLQLQCAGSTMLGCAMYLRMCRGSSVGLMTTLRVKQLRN